MKDVRLSDLRMRKSGLGGERQLDTAALNALAMKWESDIDPTAEFRLFLSLNKSGSLLGSSTSTCHSASRLEIWNTADHSVAEVVAEDFHGVSSITWRGDDSCYFGSHKAAIRYYRDGAFCQTYGLCRFTGSTAWVRSLALNCSEDYLIAGNVCSLVQVWDTKTAALAATLRSESEEEGMVNVISAVAAHPSLPQSFISGAHDGKVSLWDVRCRDLVWRFLAHSGKLNSASFSECGRTLLSSGRDGVIRLWDSRKLPPNEELISDYVVDYKGHDSAGHWVPAHFLNLGKYVLTGSETNKAFVYETLTGRLMRAISLGTSKVILTAPVPESFAFYYVNLSTRTIGLCDVGGSDVLPRQESPQQIRQNFAKEKMQEVLLDHSDLIVNQLHRLGLLERTGLHQIIDTLYQSEDPESRRLVAVLLAKCEEHLRSSRSELADRIMSSAILPNCIFQQELRRFDESLLDVKMTQQRTAFAPAVKKEVTPGAKDLPGYLSEDIGWQDCREEEPWSCFLCHYCSGDVE